MYDKSHAYSSWIGKWGPKGYSRKQGGVCEAFFFRTPVWFHMHSATRNRTKNIAKLLYKIPEHIMMSSRTSGSIHTISVRQNFWTLPSRNRDFFSMKLHDKISLNQNFCYSAHPLFRNFCRYDLDSESRYAKVQKWVPRKHVKLEHNYRRVRNFNNVWPKPIGILLFWFRNANSMFVCLWQSEAVRCRTNCFSISGSRRYSTPCNPQDCAFRPLAREVIWSTQG